MSKLVYKNFFFLFVVQFSNYVLPFLVIPLLTRALGVEGFGKYAFYLGIANLLLVFIRFGFEFSATRDISIHSDNLEKVGTIVGSVMQIKALLFFLTILLYSVIIILFQTDEQQSLLLLAGGLLLAGQTLLPIWYFQGMQQMKYVTFYTVITKILYVSLLLLLIRDNDDYGVAAVVYGASFFLSGLISFIHVLKQIPVKFTSSLTNTQQTFKDALPFFTSRIFVTAYTSSMIPLLGFIGGPAQVAVYAASEKLYMAAQSIMYPLANSLYPHVAKNKDIKLFKKLFVVALLVVLVGGIIGYFVAPHLIIFLFGAEYAESVQIFNLHMVALVFVFPSIMLGYPLLAALGFSKAANSSVIVGAIIFFIVAAYGYFSGIVDTQYYVWAVISAEASVFFLRAYFSVVRVFNGTAKGY